MRANQRPVAALIGVWGLVIAALTFAFAGSASAAPYTRAPVLSVSTQAPTVGATVNFSGSGYLPGVVVNLTLQPGAYDLGSVTPDRSGSFSTLITLPAGVSGSHTVVGAGAAPNDTASTTLVIGVSAAGGGSAGGGGGGGSGGLPNTGAAVIGLGALGLALSVGGALMLFAGKRRSVRAA